MLIKTDAFVLKSQKYHEADSLLTLFSKKTGRMTAVAKGSRRARSKMLAGIQPFTYSQFLLYEGRSMYTVNQVDPKAIFYSIREDYQKLAYASYLAELVETEISEGQPHPQLFYIFGKGLLLLSQSETNPETLLRAFELHYMRVCGYEPQLKQCIDCSTTGVAGWSFSCSQGGIVCPQCISRFSDAQKISNTGLKLIRYLLSKPLHETAAIKIHPRLNNEISELLKHYLLYHTARYQFKSLRFIAESKKAGTSHQISGLTVDRESDTFNSNNHNVRSNEKEE